MPRTRPLHHVSWTDQIKWSYPGSVGVLSAPRAAHSVSTFSWTQAVGSYGEHRDRVGVNIPMLLSTKMRSGQR